MEDKYLWWKDGIIYQIYPRSFSDCNNDGIGDIPGIIAKLDYLSDLGVDAIWLSPVYPSPQVDFGYDVSNYVDIDPIFCSLKDFDRLVKEAHKRGIRIIMDLVFNHTSDEHPWFIQAKQSRDNPYHDWYIWRDPNPKGGPPNNWNSIFGGKVWKYNEAIGQYYLHLFHEKQPDLNWRNPRVQKAIMDVLKFWLERGTDGFRLDVFNAYFKHPDLPDNPVKRMAIRGYERQEHLYDGDQPEMLPLLAKFRKLLDQYPERYVIGETFNSTPVKAALYCGDDRLHAAFNFSLLESKWNPRQYLSAITQWEKAVGNRIWPSYVLNNHDNPRSVTRWKDDDGDHRARIAATLLLTLRGTAFIYNGEEIGMRDLDVKHSEIMDPPGKRYWPLYNGRDGCRSPMQWDASLNSGFSKARPWLRVHPEYPRRNVSSQLRDEHSLLNFYKRLISLRRHSIVLRRGNFSVVKHNNSNCLVYLRSYAKKSILVALNFSSKPQKLKSTLTQGALGSEIFSTQPLQKKPRVLDTLRLEPYQAVLFELTEGK
ncbi:MAG: alpha-glucosidase [Anaerolineaceae bacterium]